MISFIRECSKDFFLSGSAEKSGKTRASDSASAEFLGETINGGYGPIIIIKFIIIIIIMINHCDKSEALTTFNTLRQ